MDNHEEPQDDSGGLPSLPDEEPINELVNKVTRAIDNLPIVARLEFVRNLLSDHGGDRVNSDREDFLVVATEIVGDVIKVLNHHPAAAQLRKPEP